MSKRSSRVVQFVVAATVSLAAASAWGQEADALLRRAAGAMGGIDVKSVRYSYEGTGYTYGQAYTPAVAWPKVAIAKFVRTIDYESPAMRDEMTYSRAEPRGGGGYPLTGEARLDAYVNGGYAWNVVGGNPAPGSRFVRDRKHQLWITPHGVLKAARRYGAKLEFPEKAAHGTAKVSFSVAEGFVATAWFDADNRLTRVESRAPDAVMGETVWVTTYSDYRDFGGVAFPGRIRQSAGGHEVLDVTVKEVQVGVATDLAVPANVQTASERITTDKVADGVWFVAGGSHNSAVIEMKDHLVLVEAPLNDARSGLVIDQVKLLAPGKPIRYVINSHNHFDHAGGLRAAVADGATVVTQAGNKAFFEKAFATPNRIAPDRLAKSGKKAKIMAVEDKATLTDGTRTIEVLRITGGVHNDTFLMAYLPKEKLLIEADAYTPQPPGAQPPATPNANHVNLVENIERRKLVVERILPLHGRVVPIADLYTTTKMTPK